MEILGGLLIVGFIVAFFASAFWARRQFDASLADLAEEYGLEVYAGDLFSAPTAGGVVKGVVLTIDTYVVRSGKSSTTYTRVRGSGDVPPELRIAPEGLLAGLTKAFGAVDVQLGDPALDRVAMISGHPREIRALLDAPARRAVRELVSEGGRLEAGEWTLARQGLVMDRFELQAMVDAVVDATAALRVDGRTDAERLKAIVEADPEPTVRLNALLALGRWADPAWLERLAAGDDAEIGVVAARTLGPSGRVALARFLWDSRTSVRRYAALALARMPEAPVDGLEDVLRRCLTDDPGDGDVIDALGAVGTAASVPDLQAIAGAGLGLAPGAGRAKSAVRAIQSRITVGQGALALAEDGDRAGGLSLAEAQRRRGRETQ